MTEQSPDNPKIVSSNPATVKGRENMVKGRYITLDVNIRLGRKCTINIIGSSYDDRHE